MGYYGPITHIWVTRPVQQSWDPRNRFGQRDFFTLAAPYTRARAMRNGCHLRHRHVFFIVAACALMVDTVTALSQVPGREMRLD